MKLDLVTPWSDQRGMGTRISKPRQKAANIDRRLVPAMIGVMLCVMASGCQVPRYQFPKGYSSTYARHLHAQESLGIPPGELPTVEKSSQTPGIFYSQSFKYEPPTKSEFQRTVTVFPEDRPRARRRY